MPQACCARHPVVDQATGASPGKVENLSIKQRTFRLARLAVYLKSSQTSWSTRMMYPSLISTMCPSLLASDVPGALRPSLTLTTME